MMRKSESVYQLAINAKCTALNFTKYNPFHCNTCDNRIYISIDKGILNLLICNIQTTLCTSRPVVHHHGGIKKQTHEEKVGGTRKYQV